MLDQAVKVESIDTSRFAGPASVPKYALRTESNTIQIHSKGFSSTCAQFSWQELWEKIILAWKPHLIFVTVLLWRTYGLQFFRVLCDCRWKHVDVVRWCWKRPGSWKVHCWELNFSPFSMATFQAEKKPDCFLPWLSCKWGAQMFNRYRWSYTGRRGESHL